MSTWINDDGLVMTYGADRAKVGPTGEYSNEGLFREVEIDVDLTTLTETETVLSENTHLPKGVFIQEISVTTEVAAVTGVAIDLGLQKLDHTELDYNGLLAAFPLASMDTPGEETVLRVGSSNVGSLVGTVLSEPGLLSISCTTSTAFTAGKIRIRIRYYRP